MDKVTEMLLMVLLAGVCGDICRNDPPRPKGSGAEETGGA